MSRSSLKSRVRVYAVSITVLGSAIGFAGVVRGTAQVPTEERSAAAATLMVQEAQREQTVGVSFDLEA